MSKENSAEIVHRNDATSLVDRLDDSLGEASSGIGVLLSELVRRTLRGGVQKIDDEMQSFVEEKVDDTIASRMPEFEDAATRTASERAKQIAEEAVDSLGRETRETAGKLAEQISGIDARASQMVAETKAEASRLEERINGAEQSTEQKLERITTNSRSVLGKIEGNLKKLRDDVKMLATELEGDRERRSQEHAAFASQLQQMTTQMAELAGKAEGLAGRVGELEAELVELKKPKGLFARLFGKKNQ